MWDTYGSAGGNMNHTFTPSFQPFDECKGANRFAAAFKQIVPAPKGGCFRGWTWSPAPTTPGQRDPTGTVDEIVFSPTAPRRP